MAISYGRMSKRIGASDIDSVIVTHMTILEEGEDNTGGYYLTVYPNAYAGGCSVAPDPYVYVNIKNWALHNWRRLSFKTYGTFVASCWDLNESVYNNNILTYSTGSGDRIFKSVNCFELPQFNVQTAACDNASTNAFHTTYKVGSYREWYQTRRRNSLTTVAGPAVHLSCNSTNTGSLIRFSDIFVFS